jgi:hypothetical protein
MRTQCESWQHAGPIASIEPLENRMLMAANVVLPFDAALAGSPAAIVDGRHENSGVADTRSGASHGSVKPHRNLQVILRGEGFGLVKFRQPRDDAQIVYLDVWVRGLAPNTTYVLQRAVDSNVDGICTSTAWLTLGEGLQPQSITTDANGAGRAELFRDLAAVPAGSAFDIHFRVIEQGSSAVVLTSECYQFVVSQ